MLIRQITKNRPQNGTQNRPTIDLGVNLAPKRGPRESKRAPETEFGRFLIDLGPNFDRFWTDLGPNLDRFGPIRDHFSTQDLESMQIA